VLATIEPSFAAIEPERFPIELTVASVETSIDPVRARAVSLIDAGVPALHALIRTVHAGFAMIETPFHPLVVRSGGRDAGHEPCDDGDNEGGLPR
jgi:hypothetical protein